MAEMTNHDLDPIRDKVELLRSENAGAPPFAILTNNATPTPEERVAIAKWATIRDGCFQRGSQATLSAPLPSSVRSVDRNKSFSFSRQASQLVSVLVVALYEGKMTYSEFAKERAQIGGEVAAAKQEWLQTLAAATEQRRQQQEQVAIQREQLAEQRYQAWLQASMQQTQQMQSQLRSLHTTMTDCSWFGNSWTCTTR